MANFATSFGGGAYTTLGGESSSDHVITIQSCDFVDNKSGRQAGGLEIDLGSSGEGDSDSYDGVIVDCLFRGNKAVYGGAMYIFYTGKMYNNYYNT